MAACPGTESGDKGFLNAKGIVKYLSLEGGFYGIITGDNQHFDPLNLPKEFQKDGMQIYFKYVKRKDIVTHLTQGLIYNEKI